MDLLSPKIQRYPWGTADAIADLQGRPVPAPGPEAELWMGAHPSAPAALDRPLPPSITTATSASPVTLDAVIAADPERELGAEVAARFLEDASELEKQIRALAFTPRSAGRTRIHGDLHLGQVLIVQQDVRLALQVADREA